jgi:triacylglycerol esterase/lipase EstA (alpha/beta hydrolase family)
LRSIAFLAAALLSACGSSSGDPSVEVRTDPGSGSGAGFAGEPPLETDPAKLEAGLVCTPFVHPDKPPVLLVHGTFTSGYEQYDWTYLPLLDNLGFDVCEVTYPDRGFGDQQVSAEYVVYALREMHARSGRKVAMIGHSQGAAVPRWALKWWPSAREATEDFVLQAGPSHGTQVALLPPLLPGLTGLPAAFFQFSPDSNFVRALNEDDETPGDVSYTSLYTMFDELVQPVTPVPTAALDLGQDNPKVTNLLLQDLCPGRFVDHVTIGLTDRLAFELTLDAISNPGPLDIERAGGASGLCGLLPIIPDQIIASEIVTGMLGILPKEPIELPDLHLVGEEPPLKPYAQ